jgi:hypothetical protein
MQTISSERKWCAGARLASGWSLLALCVAGGGAVSGAETRNLPAHFAGWTTNGPAVYAQVRVPWTNSLNRRVIQRTNEVFDHFVPGSLPERVWTDFIAHTNRRGLQLWVARTHSPSWPTDAPVLAWNTNSVAWGMKGLTALSPCWQGEGSTGQVPITALTRRHGYTRGHGMGPDGFYDTLKGQRVWFLAENGQVVEVRVAREVVRTLAGGAARDYTLLLFDRDLPASIQPLRVVAATNLAAKCRCPAGAPCPMFKTEQGGYLSAEVPGFTVNTWKAGDSGSPDLLPLDSELIFCSGRSTSGPSPEMQSDMNELCALEGLKADRYQLQWVDLAQYPSYGR